MRFRILFFVLACLIGQGPSAAAASKAITDFSLEELLETEVVSAARSSRPLSQTPAAIFVIDQEDIRRSTAQHVPELLRMVPGVEVARIDAHTWAITARGFNGALANKLLVMIDGRSVYTPLYAGVYWDAQDLVLEDIERIEVIRGPGGSLWGSNAINGVINIITKHTSRTQGLLATAGGGDEFQEGVLRYGGKAGEELTYRGYGKFFNHDSTGSANDAWYLGHGGFRTDWQKDAENHFTLQGHYYNGEEDIRISEVTPTSPFIRTVNEDQSLAGGNVILRWDHLFEDKSSGSLQTYFDYRKRDQSTFEEIRYTWDIEWKHQFFWGERQEIVWGAGYRLQADETTGSFSAFFEPEDRITHLYQAFLQDTVTLVHDHLWFTAGVKVEKNDFSGFEIQPTARLAWNPHPEHTLWAAFSRAVRIPSRFDHDLGINSWLTPGVVLARLRGDPNKDSETLLAYEAGYRMQPHERVSFDTAFFYNVYDNLTTFLTGTSFGENGYTVLPVYFDDHAEAETYGAEVSMMTELAPWWRVKTAYTFLEMQIHASADPFGVAENEEGASPHHQLHIRSHLNLPYDIEFDTVFRFVSRLSGQDVPAYVEADIRVGWRPMDHVLIQVIGSNLLHGQHLEFGSGARVEPERSVFAEVKVEFD